eukprot:1907820-Pyramimonas_sp.AAC.1
MITISQPRHRQGRAVFGFPHTGLGGNVSNLESATLVHDGQWHSVVVTYDAVLGAYPKRAMYVDGVLEVVSVDAPSAPSNLTR